MTLETPKADIANAPRAGKVETFPSGRLTFLAPLPLPTGLPPTDHGHAVGEVNDRYLDFGVGLPPVFGWQVTLGTPLAGFVLVAFVFPLIAFLLFYWLGNGFPDAIHAFWGVIDISFWIGLWGGGGLLLWWLVASVIGFKKKSRVVPTRFNRQRREVCFVPKGHQEPIFVPWEELVAWVTEARGVTEYGVQRQYGFGVGFVHPQTGEKYTLEFQTYGLPQAISNWEAIRAYMEYEVHTLKEIQDPLDLQGPDDPPWEGVHVFRNARARLHQRRRAGEVGWFHTLGWYLNHLSTFWSLPYHLVDWEVKKIQKMNRRALPEAMQRWSEPLPEEQWAKPSEELERLSQKVREKQQARPGRLPYEVFAEVYAEEDRLPLAPNI